MTDYAVDGIFNYSEIGASGLAADLETLRRAVFISIDRNDFRFPDGARPALRGDLMLPAKPTETRLR